MSKTQSDTGREGGLYVNKKVEKKQGRQDPQADRWEAGRDLGSGSRVRAHTPQQTPTPTQGTWERLVQFAGWTDGWMCGKGLIDRWVK